MFVPMIFSVLGAWCGVVYCSKRRPVGSSTVLKSLGVLLRNVNRIEQSNEIKSVRAFEI